MSALLSVVGLLEKIHDYIIYRPSIVFFIEFIIYSIPRYFFYLIPFVTLISSLFIFSMGVRSRELLILSLSGGKLRKSLIPFLILSILIALFAFFFSEFIQPEFTKKLNTIVEELTEKNKSISKKDVYLRTVDGTVIKIGNLEISESLTDRSKGSNIKIFILRDNALIKRIDAEEAEIIKEDWILKNVSIFDFQKGKVEKKESYIIRLELKISAAALKDIRKIEEFQIKDLLQKREELRKMGLSNPKLDTDISGRIAYNFVTLFMMILGISIPLGAYEKLNFIFARSKGSSTSGSALIIGMGLIITILYWLVYSIFIFLGYSKILPPFVAPWITPMIFGAISAKLWLSIRE